MNRPMFLLLALAAALAACGGSSERTSDVSAAEPEPSATTFAARSAATPRSVDSPTASLRLAASPRATAKQSPQVGDTRLILAAEGIGPYRIGASLADLRKRGLVRNLVDSDDCGPPYQGAEATGRYAGRVVLSFESGRLTDVATGSRDLITPSGARTGMTLGDLRRIYGDRGKLVRGYESQAFSVRVAGTKLGIVFYFESLDTHSHPTVNAITAGEVERLEQAAIVGEGC